MLWLKSKDRTRLQQSEDLKLELKPFVTRMQRRVILFTDIEEASVYLV